MTKDEALKVALNVLRNRCEPDHPVFIVIKSALEANEFNPDWDTQAVLVEEIQRMAKRIEELEAKGEPVATIDSLEQEIYENTRQFVSLNVMEWMLKRYYTTPPQRKTLTDEQAMNAYFETPPFGTYKEAFIAGIRFIEAAHGIKEEA